MLIYDLSKSINKLVVTLREKQTVATSTYLLRLTNDTTNDEYITVVEDVSFHPIRSQAFCISGVTGAPDPLLGQLDLRLAGYYHYYFYQNTDSLLEYEDLLMVEDGKLLVVGPLESPDAYQSNINPDLTVYDPNTYTNE